MLSIWGQLAPPPTFNLGSSLHLRPFQSRVELAPPPVPYLGLCDVHLQSGEVEVCLVERVLDVVVQVDI